jgi:hypothetical protein
MVFSLLLEALFCEGEKRRNKVIIKKREKVSTIVLGIALTKYNGGVKWRK